MTAPTMPMGKKERTRPSATVTGRARGELEGGTPVKAHDLPELSFVHPLPGFPGGLLVVHDGENTPEVPGPDGEARPNTNFKFLDAGFLRR